MSRVVRTTEEFCTRRKVRYGTGEVSETKSAPQATVSATLTPHKVFYDKDSDGNNAYFIEFTIGDFNFDEITIRTEG